MMPAIGARKTAYALMKLRKVFAFEMIIQGTMAQPPTTIANKAPRRILKYWGQREVISVDWSCQEKFNNEGFGALPLPNDTVFADILTQIWARHQRAAQKKAAARPPWEPCHWAKMSRGLQRTVPYKGLEAAAPTTPKMLTKILKIGMKGSCQTWDPGFLANREKSGIFTASVEKPPVIEVMLESHSQARAEPVTVAFWFQKSGASFAATAK
jgi:hypothetical protein